MSSIETPQVESARNSTIDPKVRKLLDGPPSNNYMHRQVQLAVEKFSLEHPSDTLSDQLIHDVMTTWQASVYSTKWRELIKHNEFNDHPRFKGKLENVTLEDLEYFIKTNELPNWIYTN